MASEKSAPVGPYTAETDKGVQLKGVTADIRTGNVAYSASVGDIGFSLAQETRDRVMTSLNYDRQNDLLYIDKSGQKRTDSYGQPKGNEREVVKIVEGAIKQALSGTELTANEAKKLDALRETVSASLQSGHSINDSELKAIRDIAGVQKDKGHAK